MVKIQHANDRNKIAKKSLNIYYGKEVKKRTSANKKQEAYNNLTLTSLNPVFDMWVMTSPSQSIWMDIFLILAPIPLSAVDALN